MTEEQLNTIHDMAAHFMSPSDIAFYIGMDEEEFNACLQDPQNEIHIRYRMGKISSMMELRRKVVSMAKKGSPQAETLVESYIADQSLKESL